jgi:hypothetical protein
MSKNNESRVIRALAGFLVLLTALRETSRRFDRSQPPPTPPAQSPPAPPADPSPADVKLMRRAVPPYVSGSAQIEKVDVADGTETGWQRVDTWASLATCEYKA